MLKEIVEKRIIGVNFSAEKVADILLWAPRARNVDLQISEKLIPLEEKEYGYWRLNTSEIHPDDKYMFTINRGKSFADPASLAQPDGVHESSQAVDLNSFVWTDKNWKGLQTRDLIIYELHTGTFTKEGTFEGINSRLNYLKGLGITAIEIMPIAQFPGNRNWGYDGVFLFAVQNSYGGALGLQKLVDACHRENIAVILDVVYNHLGPEGNYLENFAPFFTSKYKTPWGNAINFDDEWCDGVRRFYIENALMWMRDFHVDGLRLDAVHAIKDFGAKHIIEDISDHVKELTALSGRNHFLIGESDLNDVRFINPPEKGGYGLDCQWVDEFHHSLHSLVTGEKNGYYSDFGSIDHLEKSFNNAYVFDGIYSPHRKKTFGNKTTGQPAEKFIIFTQNHDQIGNRIKGNRLSTVVDFELLKLIGGTLFINPFLPMIFMGEEYGETSPFLYITSHGNEDLIDAVKEGRKNEFKDFILSGETFHDPQSLDTFSLSKLELNLHLEGNHAFIFSFYKELIRLKKFHPVLKYCRRENTKTINLKTKDILLQILRNDGHFLLSFMNFDNKALIVDLSGVDDEQLQVLLNSSEPKWGGKGEKSTDDGYKIKLVDFVDLSCSPHTSLKSPLTVAAGSLLLLSDIYG